MPTRDPQALLQELRTISEFITRARVEIAALRPHEGARHSLPGAGAELDAIVRDTEAATDTIMGAAEALMGSDTADLSSYRAEVQAGALSIIEACAFQDITGQRVGKVVAALRQVEERIARLGEVMGVQGGAPEEASGRLHGPGLHGPETSQAEVDALLAAPRSSQDDIDALFD